MADTHENFMNFALDEAKKAGQIGEVPIGAILVSKNGEILSAAHNKTITRTDPTAHALCVWARLSTPGFHGLFLGPQIPNGGRQDHCITTRRIIG